MRRSHSIALVIFALTLLALGRVYQNQFVEWDDYLLIVENPHLNPATLSGLAWHWSHAHQSMYIPVIYTTWWGLIRLTGQPDASVFHVCNLLVHLCSVSLVFLLLRRLVRTDWPAAAGAILFAIHPLQVEPVAWATGMKDVLSTLLALLALLAYLQFVRRHAWRAYAAATLLFVLALLAKPSVVTLPLVAVTLEFVSLREGSGSDGFNWWRSAAWLAIAAVAAIVASIAQPASKLHYVPIWARPLIVADALAFYLWKLAWPVNLAINYGRTPAMVLRPAWNGLAPAYITWIAPAGLALALVRRPRRQYATAAMIFVISLLPVLGLLPFAFQEYSTVADRYTYLAMLGPALAAACLMKRYSGPGTICVAMLVAASLAAISFLQAGYWKDMESLDLREVQVNPLDFGAHHNIGLILANRGDVTGAVQEYQTVIELHPDATPEYRYVADAKAAMADYPAAVDYASRLIAIQTQLPPVHQSDPAELHVWLGGIYLRWADALKPADPMKAASNYALAAKECGEAARLNPTDKSAMDGLSAARQGMRALGLGP